MSKAAFNGQQVAAFMDHVENRVPQGKMRFSPMRPPEPTPVNDVIKVPQDLIADWYRDYPYLVGPVFYESPFFWHFARFADAIATPKPARGGPVDFEDSIGERVLFVLLGVATLLGGLFLFVPLWRTRDEWTKMRFKASWATYFACLGLGFMLVEVAMIQKLTLLLGYPTRSLTVTLFALLVSTGAGSFLSSRYAENWERAVGRLLAALVTWVAIWLFVTPHAVAALVGYPLFVRALAAVALTAPFGLCLGGFLPIGIRAITGVAGQAPGAVAWAWAINAFFSVIGSILSAILAMMVGFKFLIIGAPVIYAAGVLALVRMAAPRAASDAA
jgi:hypothetical protein